ncbi:MAG: RNA methyltransferase [Pseudomonadota bacterium]
MSPAAIQPPGRVKEIESASNAIVKDIKSLEKKRVREETNSFFVEGQKLLIDALDQGWSVKTLIVAKNSASEERSNRLIQRCVAAGVDVLLVSKKVLTSVARRDNPQMVCGVIERRFRALPTIQIMKGETWIALDRVRDPGNLGTIIRTADALGASGIILVGDTTDPYAIDTVRATMGSIFNNPIVRATQDEFAKFVANFSGQVVATHLAGSVDFREVDFSGKPTILLMGNEQSGLPDALVQLATQLVRIPQTGSADSLNLAIATAICLFRAREHALPKIGEQSQ